MLSVEPLKLASGRSLQLAAGEAVPSSSVIVRNGAGQRLTKAFLEGQKQQLSVLQRLWRLTEASGELLHGAGLRYETVPGLLSRDVGSVVSAATKPASVHSPACMFIGESMQTTELPPWAYVARAHGRVLCW